MPDLSYPLIALWSAPRSRSTSFLRMMVERKDFEVLSEPFCEFVTNGYYLSPISKQKCYSLGELAKFIVGRNRASPVFFKDTTEYSLAGLAKEKLFLSKATHCVILRNLKEVILSHHAVEPKLTKEEIGFQNLLEIIQIIRNNSDKRLIFLNSQNLVANPTSEIQRYCKLAGIEFFESALTWSRGHIPIWDQTRQYHEDVSESEGFLKTRTYDLSMIEKSSFLSECYAYQKPFYDEIVKIQTQTNLHDCKAY